MSFLSDLESSQEGVDVVESYFRARGFNTEIFGKKQQAYGDLYVFDPSCFKTSNVEVKFDKRAARSGNLCFELSNNRGETGISTTLADVVAYVVPDKDHYTLYFFKTSLLRKDIESHTEVKIKMGGDGKRFRLAIVKRSVVEDDFDPTIVKVPRA